MHLPTPTGFKITEKHHPYKVAPVGHGLLHLCHARREHETIRDAGIAAEPLPFTGISEGTRRGRVGCREKTLLHANQDVV